MVSALQLTLHLAALAGDLAMAVSWVAGNENHDEATGREPCRIPTNLPSLAETNALMHAMARDVAHSHISCSATCVTCVTVVSAACLPGCLVALAARRNTFVREG